MHVLCGEVGDVLEHGAALVAVRVRLGRPEVALRVARVVETP